MAFEFGDLKEAASSAKEFAGTAGEAVSEVKGAYDDVVELGQSVGILDAPANPNNHFVNGREVPKWIPDFQEYTDDFVAKPQGPRAPYFGASGLVKRALIGLYEIGASLDDVIRIGQLDRMAGLAPAGTPLDRLNPAAQRRVVANDFAIAMAKFRTSPEAAQDAIDRIWALQKEQLGWQRRGTPGCQSTDHIENTGGVAASGVPCTVTPVTSSSDALGDMAKALTRVLLVAKGQVPAAGVAGQLGMDPLDLPGAGFSGEGAETCFNLPLPTERLDCIDGYEQTTPGTVQRLLRTHKPWEAGADASKSFQLTQGFDGRRFIVAGSNPGLGISTRTAMVVGGVLLAGTAWWLTKTKKGKKFRKRYL